MKVCLQLQALNDKIGQGGRITAVYYREGCLLDTILHMFRANAAIYLKIFPRFFFFCPYQCNSCRPGCCSLN